MSDWNSAQYMKFANERTQPSRDLISRISDFAPQSVLDIGCGPGNSTKLLADTFPKARLLGIDSSDDMLCKARQTYENIKFKKCFVPDDLGEIDGSFDLIFSNACIHWIPEQEKLLKAVFAKLNDGGRLAVQIPFIQNAEFYRLLGGLTSSDKWQKLSDVHNFHNLLPEEYYDLLSKLSRDFQIWETVYYHTVSSSNGVIEWYKGSGLRPYLDRLTSSEKAEFISDLSRLLREHYPIRANGRVILKMPRMFFTAIK